MGGPLSFSRRDHNKIPEYRVLIKCKLSHEQLEFRVQEWLATFRAAMALLPLEDCVRA